MVDFTHRYIFELPMKLWLDLDTITLLILDDMMNQSYSRSNYSWNNFVMNAPTRSEAASGPVLKIHCESLPIPTRARQSLPGSVLQMDKGGRELHAF